MNELKIGNIKCSDLAKKFGTPLYVYDEKNMINIMADYIENFKSDKYKTEVIYASKAFACLEMYKLVNKMNLGCDVVSMGEIYGALTSGFDPSKIYFHGNNKQQREIEEALNNDIINIVCDNFSELQDLEEISLRLKKKVRVFFRVNVGVEAHTHKFIVTAHVDSKFGMLINSSELNKCLSEINNSSYLEFVGFHSHIGSQIFEINAFYAAIDKLLEYVKTFDKTLSLNIGGGFGVRYTLEDAPIKISELCKLLVTHTDKKLDELNIKLDKLIIEPGRSIVGESGYTLYTIGNIKQTPNKLYYFVDGGMADNIRPALYEALYDCSIVNKLDSKDLQNVCIAGKYCESGDIIIESINLPVASKGDILCVYTTGAYGYSMSSNYNKANTPSVVFVNGNKAREVVKRQSLKDLYKNDLIDGEVYEIF